MLTLDDARALKLGSVIHQRLVWPAVSLDTPCVAIKVTAISLRRRDFTVRGIGQKMLRGQARPFQVAVNRHSASHYHLASAACSVAPVTAQEVARA